MVEMFDDANRSRRSGLRPEESAENWAVEPGMVVVGSDGGDVGRVKEVRRTDFLVDRRLAVDLYIPYSACQSVEGDQVQLNVAAGDVTGQGWATTGSPVP